MEHVNIVNLASAPIITLDDDTYLPYLRGKRVTKLPPFELSNKGGLATGMTPTLTAEAIDDVIYHTMWIASAKSQSDVALGRGWFNRIFDKARKLGFTTDDYPDIKSDLKGRMDVRFKKYRLAARFCDFETDIMKGFKEATSDEFWWPIVHLINQQVVEYALDPRKPFPMPSFIPGKFKHYETADQTYADKGVREIELIRQYYGLDRSVVLFIQDYHNMYTAALARTTMMDRRIADDPNITLIQKMHTPFFDIEAIADFLLEDRAKNRADIDYGKPVPNAYDATRHAVGSLCGNDVLVFHTKEWAQNYKKALEYFDFDGHKIGPMGKNNFVVKHPHSHKQTIVTWVPIGIDHDIIDESMNNLNPISYQHDNLNGSLEDRLNEWKTEGSEKKIVFASLGRNEYTKGNLEAVETYNRARNKLVTRAGLDTVMTIVSQPSRPGAKGYNENDKNLHEVTDSLNIASLEPHIHYCLQNMDSPDKEKYMAQSDVLMVTTIADGMNVVIEEAISAKGHLDYKNRGLIVVANSGAAQYFKSKGFHEGHGLVYVDALNHEEASEKIYKAWMSGERISQKLVNHTRKHLTAQNWQRKIMEYRK